MKALEILMPLAQMLPVGDHIDPDGLVKHITESLGVPKTTLRSTAEIQQARQQRQMAEQQQAEAMQESQEVQDIAQLAQATRMVGK
jgi:hypothetical protein